MTIRIDFNNLEIGYEIPKLVKCVTTQQMARWAGATDEYYEIHYDKDYAIKQGLPGVIVAGGMIWAFLSQMIINWVGEPECLKKINCTFRGMQFPNEEISCKGKIAKKYTENGKRYVECDIWVENSKGEKSSSGLAIPAFPLEKG